MKNRGKKYQLGGAFGPGQMQPGMPPQPTGGMAYPQGGIPPPNGGMMASSGMQSQGGVPPNTGGVGAVVGQQKGNVGNKSTKINNKNVLNKNKNSKGKSAKNNLNNLNPDEEMFVSSIESYQSIIILLIIILVLCIIGYFVSFSYRESKALFELSKVQNYMFIDSRVNTRAYRNNKLCDFYVASAFRPYLVKNQRLEYCSLNMLKNILMMGVRCVYIDVFNSTLNEDAYPIVTTGIKEGEWKLGLNSLLFEDVCVIIASIVFSNGYVNNHRDPFILCLNLNTNGNVKCLNRIKRIIYKIFRSNLLPNDYTYSSKNMAEEPIKNLLGKVIIFCSDGYQNSQLEEMVNYSWDKDHLNKISYKSLDPDIPEADVVKYNSNSLREFNKNNMTILTPSETAWFTSNYNSLYGMAAGCQLLFMNYNLLGSNLDSYLTKFRNDSFLPKPISMTSTTSGEVESIEKIVVKSLDESGATDRLNCPIDSGQLPAL